MCSRQITFRRIPVLLKASTSRADEGARGPNSDEGETRDDEEEKRKKSTNEENKSGVRDSSEREGYEEILIYTAQQR